MPYAPSGKHLNCKGQADNQNAYQAIDTRAAGVEAAVNMYRISPPACGNKKKSISLRAVLSFPQAFCMHLKITGLYDIRQIAVPITRMVR